MRRITKSRFISYQNRRYRKRSPAADHLCNGDVTPVTTNAACRGFQLGRDLPDDAAASVARAATSTGRGCAVDIPGCIDGHRTDRTGSVTSTGKIVQICLRPAALGRRQLKYRAMRKSAVGAGRTIEIAAGIAHHIAPRPTRAGEVVKQVVGPLPARWRELIDSAVNRSAEETTRPIKNDAASGVVEVAKGVQYDFSPA